MFHFMRRSISVWRTGSLLGESVSINCCSLTLQPVWFFSRLNHRSAVRNVECVYSSFSSLCSYISFEWHISHGFPLSTLPLSYFLNFMLVLQLLWFSSLSHLPPSLYSRASTVSISSFFFESMTFWKPGCVFMVFFTLPSLLMPVSSFP